MSRSKAAIKPILPARAALPVILLALLLLSSLTSAQNDNCCHIDRQCTTDHEWISGYYAFQNGECVAGQQQPQATATPAQAQATASAGSSSQVDNCCFVDRHCNANHEWINGYWAYQNNQCGASQQQGTPTSSPSQAQGGTSSQIDNCCFVDRLCESDEQWTSGYWAYQNNQCPGAQNSQSQPRAQEPASEAVDNCCFIGWQCSTDEEWVLGYWAYQANSQCPAPAQQGRQTRDSDKLVSETYDPATRGYTWTYEGGFEATIRRPTRQELCDAGLVEFCDDE